jgi:hypothetical protein
MKFHYHRQTIHLSNVQIYWRLTSYHLHLSWSLCDDCFVTYTDEILKSGWRTCICSEVEEGVVLWSPVDTLLADACALTKRRKCHVFLPSPMHARPRHSPWAMCIRLSHVKAESEFPTLWNGDLSAKGENTDRKTSILQVCWRLE